jgi:hypothetical protein
MICQQEGLSLVLTSNWQESFPTHGRRQAIVRAVDLRQVGNALLKTCHFLRVKRGARGKRELGPIAQPHREMLLLLCSCFLFLHSGRRWSGAIDLRAARLMSSRASKHGDHQQPSEGLCRPTLDRRVPRPSVEKPHSAIPRAILPRVWESYALMKDEYHCRSSNQLMFSSPAEPGRSHGRNATPVLGGDWIFASDRLERLKPVG